MKPPEEERTQQDYEREVFFSGLVGTIEEQMISVNGYNPRLRGSSARALITDRNEAARLMGTDVFKISELRGFTYHDFSKDPPVEILFVSPAVVKAVCSGVSRVGFNKAIYYQVDDLGVVVEEISHHLFSQQYNLRYQRSPAHEVTEMIGALDRFQVLSFAYDHQPSIETSGDEITASWQSPQLVHKDPEKRGKLIKKLLVDNVFAFTILDHFENKPHIIGHRLAVDIISCYLDRGEELDKFVSRLRNANWLKALSIIFKKGIKIPFYTEADRQSIESRLLYLGIVYPERYMEKR